MMWEGPLNGRAFIQCVLKLTLAKMSALRVWLLLQNGMTVSCGLAVGVKGTSCLHWEVGIFSASMTMEQTMFQRWSDSLPFTCSLFTMPFPAPCISQPCDRDQSNIMVSSVKSGWVTPVFAWFTWDMYCQAPCRPLSDSVGVLSTLIWLRI